MLRIVFMGAGEICLPSLHWLCKNSGEHHVVGVFTQPDKPIGRKQILTPPAVKTVALEAGIPVFQPDSFRKEPTALEALRGLAPDLIIVMAYGQILPRSVIWTPALACLNLHASLLPRHRGASPIQAAIRDGDEETGITLMHIVPKLDAGDMILKKTITIGEDETGGELHDRLAELGPDVLAAGLPLCRENEIKGEPQEEALVTYSGKLLREDGEIDWTRSAETISRLIRAYDPWPGTYTALGGKKLKIFPSTKVGEKTDAAPGTILSTEAGLTMSCGEGSLVLSGDLQLEGRKRLPVGQFLRGADIASGTILGID